MDGMWTASSVFTSGASGPSTCGAPAAPTETPTMAQTPYRTSSAPARAWRPSAWRVSSIEGCWTSTRESPSTGQGQALVSCHVTVEAVAHVLKFKINQIVNDIDHTQATIIPCIHHIGDFTFVTKLINDNHLFRVCSEWQGQIENL